MRSNIAKILVLIALITSAMMFCKTVLAPDLTAKERLVLGESAFSALTEPLFYEPVYVSIPITDMPVHIQKVGVGSDFAMEVPDDAFTLGWLTSSSRVGENGNMILSGHFDDSFGRPGVFYNLSSLKKGNKVKVRNENGQVYEYIVTGSEYVGEENINGVFTAYRYENRPVLTLITCGGVWNEQKGAYDKRLIVKAVLE